MKVYLFAAAAIVAVLFSCSKTEVQPAGDVSVSTFTARTVSTKITIDSEWRLWWEVDDAVAINDGSATYSFSADAAGSTTTLSREGFEIDAAADYHAVFPYAAVSGFSGSTATITVAGGRTAAAGVYPSAPSVAKTTGAARSFSFLNVCGLVSFVLTESDVASIVLFGGNGEDIAGTVTVSTETGVVGEVVAGEKSILLKPAAGSAFATGRYYVAVLPGSFSGGMSISLYKTDGTRVRRNINAFTLGRSTHVDLENVDEGRTWKTSYTIKNADELQAFLSLADRLPASSVVSLANDIDLGGVVLEPAASFSGTFDGAGHKLTNWTASAPLFNTLSAGAAVRGLSIDSSCILSLSNSSPSALAFVAGVNNGDITECSSAGTVTIVIPESSSIAFNIGPIAGESSGNLSQCSNTGSISVSGGGSRTAPIYCIGGIAGRSASPSFSSSGTSWALGNSNYGDISVNTAHNIYAGGVLGMSSGSLERSKSRGDIRVDACGAQSCIGGLVGRHESSARIGNANNVGIESDLVNIDVIGASSSVCVGGCVGSAESDAAGLTYPACALSISGLGLYVRRINAAGATAGLIAGAVSFTGGDDKYGIMLGSSGSERPRIYEYSWVNGVAAGKVGMNSDEDYYFGSISPSSHWFCSFGSTVSETRLCDGLQSFSPSTPVGLKVGSYNLWTSNSRNKYLTSPSQRFWKPSLPAMVEAIEEMDCDIFAFQEVCDSIYGKNGKLFSLREEMGDSYTWAFWSNVDGKRVTPSEGTLSYSPGICYRNSVLELLDGGVFWLGGAPSSPVFVPSVDFEPESGADSHRACVWAKMRHKASTKVFYFLSAHLDTQTYPNVNRENCRNLMAYAGELIPEGVPAVIAGDMNASPSSPGFTAYLSNNAGRSHKWKNAYSCAYSCSVLGPMAASNATTVNSASEVVGNSRIDHVFFDGFFISSYETLQKKYTTAGGEDHYPSDHFPLVVELSFTEKGGEGDAIGSGFGDYSGGTVAGFGADD